MKDQIDCRVTSGETLRFSRFKEGRPLSPMGGNYLYVRDDEGGPKIIFAGQADNLAVQAQARWAEAQLTFGVQALYTRLNITSAVRRREHFELLEALDPPMNVGEPRSAPRNHDAASGENGASAGAY